MSTCPSQHFAANHHLSIIHLHENQSRRASMFLVIALVLVLAWIGGFVVFHTAGFLIHLLLIFAVISLIMHFVRGTSAKA
jgi:flagellar biogenesis protein FliO